MLRQNTVYAKGEIDKIEVLYLWSRIVFSCLNDIRFITRKRVNHIYIEHFLNQTVTLFFILKYVFNALCLETH